MSYNFRILTIPQSAWLYYTPAHNYEPYARTPRSTRYLTGHVYEDNNQHQYIHYYDSDDAEEFAQEYERFPQPTRRQAEWDAAEGLLALQQSPFTTPETDDLAQFSSVSTPLATYARNFVTTTPRRRTGMRNAVKRLTYFYDDVEEESEEEIEFDPKDLVDEDDIPIAAVVDVEGTDSCVLVSLSSDDEDSADEDSDDTVSNDDYYSSSESADDEWSTGDEQCSEYSSTSEDSFLLKDLEGDEDWSALIQNGEAANIEWPEPDVKVITEYITDLHVNCC